VWLLVPIPHTVYLHYILTSKHMPLIHLSKGLLYCSYFILILLLIIIILFLIIIIHYHHLFTPHSSSSSTSCPATSLACIFARDILLYYSYVQPYEALAQKLSWFSSCHHGVERRRPLPWAVVVVCPRPSTSPRP